MINHVYMVYTNIITTDLATNDVRMNVYIDINLPTETFQNQIKLGILSTADSNIPKYPQKVLWVVYHESGNLQRTIFSLKFTSSNQ